MMNTNPSHPMTTRISTYLRDIADNPAMCRPVTLNDFYRRMMTLPTHAVRWEADSPADNAFTVPPNLHMDVINEVSGKIKVKEINLPVPPIHEMLLLAFEAKPRPVSFTMMGYKPIDFLAYIYQDVYCHTESVSLREVQKNFGDYKNAIVDWLRIYDTTKKFENSPMRHIRYRLSMLFDMGHSNIVLMQNRPDGPISLKNLIFKLLETDQEQGYITGALRNFKLVRQDFNLLAERCFLLRNQDDPKKMERFTRAICPSKVQGPFENHVIFKPTGRPMGAKGKKKSKLVEYPSI